MARQLASAVLAIAIALTALANGIRAEDASPTLKAAYQTCLDVGHGKLIEQAVIAPNGKAVAIATTDNWPNVWLWDLRENSAWGNCAAGFAVSIEDKDESSIRGIRIADLAFSPSGETLALIDSYHSVLRLFDLISKRQKYVAKFAGASRLSFSPNGKWIVVVGEKGAVYLWSTEQLTTRTIRKPNDQLFEPQSIRFLLDSSAIVWVERGALFSYALASPPERSSPSMVGFPGGQSARSLAWSISPNGKLVAGVVHGRRLGIWNAMDGKLMTPEIEFENAGDFHSVAFLPDGERVLIGYGTAIGMTNVIDMQAADLVSFAPTGMRLEIPYRTTIVPHKPSRLFDVTAIGELMLTGGEADSELVVWRLPAFMPAR